MADSVSSRNAALILDDDLKDALIDLIASADATGCTEDLIVVSSEALEQVRKYLNRK